MGERGVAQISEGHVSQHRDMDHRHQLAALYAEDRAAQDTIGVGVQHGVRLMRYSGQIGYHEAILSSRAGSWASQSSATAAVHDWFAEPRS